MLAVYVDQRDWNLWIPLVLLAYRTSVHESTWTIPFALLYGREASLPIELCYGIPEPQSNGMLTYQEYMYFKTQRRNWIIPSSW